MAAAALAAVRLLFVSPRKYRPVGSRVAVPLSWSVWQLLAAAPLLLCWCYSAALLWSYHVTALYCAWCEVPRGASGLSAKPKSSSCFSWLFILNVLLDVNDGPGEAALCHRANC